MMLMTMVMKFFRLAPFLVDLLESGLMAECRGRGLVQGKDEAEGGG